MRPRLKRVILIAPLAAVGLLLFIVVGGEVVMQLWNWLLPPLFGWHAVTFWQALGLLALGRILFGGFGGPRSHHSHFGRRMAWRWEAMTPEERERFREGMRGRCGSGPSASESQSQ